jgi:hypothetical protein
MCEAEAKCYMKSMYHLFNHAHSFVEQLSPLFVDSNLAATAPSNYTDMVNTADEIHKLLVNQLQTQLTTSMTNSVLNPLAQIVSNIKNIASQLEEDKVLYPQYLYYKTKLDNLKADKTQRQVENRVDSTAQHDKLNRTIGKFDASQYAYGTVHTALQESLSDLWVNRTVSLGAIMQNFICIEREIASQYTQALSQIAAVDDSMSKQSNLDQSTLAVKLEGIATSVPNISTDDTSDSFDENYRKAE